MLKKLFAILLSLIVIFGLVGCKNNSETNEITTQVQETTSNDNNESNKNEIIPNPQGVSKYENENIIAIKYLVLKKYISDELNTDFAQKADKQLKYTLENVFDIFSEGIKELSHTKTKEIVKADKIYILDIGKIDNFNYKTIFTLSETDKQYVIVNCYIELDDSTAKIDSILAQTFSQEELN